MEMVGLDMHFEALITNNENEQLKVFHSIKNTANFPYEHLFCPQISNAICRVSYSRHPSIFKYDYRGGARGAYVA